MMIIGKRLILMAACAMVGSGIVKAGQQDLPNPEVYVRAEDQERERLLSKPCTEADIGRGCYRFGDSARREFPCTYQFDVKSRGAVLHAMGSLPTDQCYKMEKPRRYRGIWIDEFEGQHFIPEGTTAPRWPRTDPNSAGWREQAERARAATIWLDVEPVKLRHGYSNGGRQKFIDFVGRKTLYPGHYGHVGMSGSEIIVDRVISLKELK
jgi:hypothetical protein